jgi:hypothetical protein
MHPASTPAPHHGDDEAPGLAETTELTAGRITPVETLAVQTALGHRADDDDLDDTTGRQDIDLTSSDTGPTARGFNDEKTVIASVSSIEAHLEQTRTTKPPPMPKVGDRPSEPRTTPGRRFDSVDDPLNAGGMNRTDENPLADSHDETMAAPRPVFSSDPSSASVEEDVIVVDDIAEELDDGEGSPHAEQEAASSVPPPLPRS